MDCTPERAQVRLRPPCATHGWGLSALLLSALLACALLLAGCGAVEKTKQVIGDMTGSKPKPAAPAPAEPPPPPPPAPAPEPPAAPAPAPAQAKVDVRHTLEQVRSLLDQGQEAQAVDELKKVLVTEPENKTALSFMKQIQEDPKQLYGRQARAYRVAQGDTLAAIAQRGMADRDQFYGLARYNGIKAPRDLKVGQMIQVPGRGPLVQAAPSPPSPSPSPSPPSTTPPPTPPGTGPGSEPAPPATPATDEKKAAADKKAAIDKHVSNARRANAAQDLCGAIKEWGAVLALDPEHKTAQYERQRALERKAKLPSSKC